jgi:hypothetical protein
MNCVEGQDGTHGEFRYHLIYCIIAIRSAICFEWRVCVTRQLPQHPVRAMIPSPVLGEGGLPWLVCLQLGAPCVCVPCP